MENVSSPCFSLCFLLRAVQQPAAASSVQFPAQSEPGSGTSPTDTQLAANDFEVPAVSLLTSISCYISFFFFFFLASNCHFNFLSLRATPVHRLLELLLPPRLRALLAADTSLGANRSPLLAAGSPQGQGDATSSVSLPAQRACRQLTVFFIFSMKLLSLGEGGLKDRRNPRSDKRAHSSRSGISK